MKMDQSPYNKKLCSIRCYVQNYKVEVFHNGLKNTSLKSISCRMSEELQGESKFFVPKAKQKQILREKPHRRRKATKTKFYDT